ncbi:ABC transporter ATP-binding protein [Carnobacteriaceae bacterium zg-ZUI252]|nr:ABC transporter ATP-binding protein [Carnobacteriaceae bacterium zg-ZUI252]MBS4769929.1 ABC transporter ATP-binding protein [Carnobacteriaceae bacterium zg-ZUI240]
MFKELFQFIKRRKWVYLLVLVAIIVEFIVMLIPTRIIQETIDSIASQTLTKDRLHTQILLLLSITVLGYVSQNISLRFLFNESNLYHYELRNRMYGKMIHMRTPFYQKFRSGDMITRFTSDTNSIVEFLGYGLLCILYFVGYLVFMIPAMAVLSPVLTVLAVIPIFIAGCGIYWVGKKQDDLYEQTREAVSGLSNEILEVVEGIRVTRAYGNSTLGQKRFRDKTQQLRQRAFHLNQYTSLYGRVAFTGVSISTALIIGVGGYLLTINQVTIGQVIAVQLYSLTLLDPMWMVADVAQIYQTSKVSFRKIIELVNETDDLSMDGNVHLDEPTTIEFKGYHFTYANSDRPALKNITLTLKKGQTLGVVGQTGSGKTTFVRQLLMQYPVGEGEFLINGKSVKDYSRASIEKQLGYVPQEHVLFSKSVEANIKIGKKDADILELAQAVESASFTQDLERMSDGIETLVGEKGVSISGGQKQRISIARALIKDPEVLILDDSLSAVDAKTETAIIQNMQVLRQGKTNIIVTHRLSAVMHADWVVVLDDGEICEEGTPQQLITRNGWFAEQYQKQQMEEV